MKKLLTNRRLLILLCLLLVTHVYLSAAPIVGKEFTFSQPDGTKVKVKIWGDEFYQRVESIDGYTLVKDSNGWISYALLSSDQNQLISSGVHYSGTSIEDAKSKFKGKFPTLVKGIEPSKEGIEKIRNANYKKLNPDQLTKNLRKTKRSAASTTGNIKGLTILIDFSDKPANMPYTDLYNYFNQIGYTGYGNNGSIRDYFLDVSNNLVDYTTYVQGYYRAKKPKSYYDQIPKYGDHELLLEALNYLDSTGFDFTSLTTDGGYIKAINFMYAGNPDHGWIEGLWPHSGGIYEFISSSGVQAGRYQLTNIGDDLSLATTCHENGHMLFGWPDLYDYHNDGINSSGVGSFCLMAGMGDSKNPVPPNAYLRMREGWENVTVANNISGNFSLTSNSHDIIKYNNPDLDREFFILESRTHSGRSASLPDEGLMIWHVDEWGNNEYQNMTEAYHYMVSLEQADGEFDLEGNRGDDSNDLYSSISGTAFSDFTLPNARWWNGTASGLSVSNISDIGSVMTFDLNTAVSGNTCTFGAPRISPLPSTGYLSYTHVHKLGVGGPNLSSVNNFAIQWDLSTNSLYNLYFNTNNGYPSWYTDLKVASTNNFASSSPSITFSNSGIPNFDGTYYVTIDNGNLVLVDVNGNFTLYMSNSATPPACDALRKASANMSLEASISPNPASTYVNIVSDQELSKADIVIMNEFGTVVEAPYTLTGNSAVIDISGLQSGIYVTKISSESHVTVKKIVVER